jgi:hypothetical protein
MRDIFSREYNNADFFKEFDRALRLSQVDPEIAKVMVEDGDGQKDKVSVSKVSVGASKLKPSQTTMVLDKSLGMAIGMLATGKIGGDLGAIISSDGYIMDGHHRWSAAVLAGGTSAKVGGYQAKLPGETLIRVLNILTKGHLNRTKGNPGKGSLTDYTPAKVKSALTKIVKNGISGDFPRSPKEIETILVDNFGSVEGGIHEIASNAKYIPTSTPSWAPDRADMPVINPHEIAPVAEKLQQGEVIIPPRSLTAMARRVAARFVAAHRVYGQR